ncbi:unnamed protein product [Calypogeia fissa]
MSVHGLLCPGGHSRTALITNSSCGDRLFRQNSLKLDKFSHSFDKRTLKSQLELSSSCKNSSIRLVCVHDAGRQRSSSSSYSERAFRVKREDQIVPEIVEEYEEMRVPRRTVAVFWDLDNKPPNHVPAYDAALRLKRLAEEFGEVVDMVAYANQNAFNYVPARVREERQDRKMLDQLETRGVVQVENPYICSMCGRKCKTNVDLKKHFRQLHERERNKRLAFLGQLKGKKRAKFLERVAPKESKYKAAAKTVLLPKTGYGLASELKRAGVAVRTVEKRPQAADEALVRHMNLYINRGIEVICLVSDDSDFQQILRFAKSKHVWTIAIGDTATLRGSADTNFCWEDVASGRGVLSAHEKFQRWSNEEALRAELYDDEFGVDSQEEAAFSDSDEEEFQEFQRSLQSSIQFNPFADDEDGYRSDEEEDDEDEDNQMSGGWDKEAEEAAGSGRFT